MHDGFIKAAAGTPRISVADVDANTAEICALLKQADAEDVNLLVLPELCITGATCADLFFSDTLIEGALNGLISLTEATKGMYPVVVVGTPIRANGKLFDCAAVLHDGEILGIVPKSFPAERWFAPGADACSVTIDGCEIPMQTQLTFSCDDLPEFSLAVIVGEDGQTPDIESSLKYSAAIIANPCASAEIVGKKEYRRLMARADSGRHACGIVSANADSRESTQDMVFSGHRIIAENGVILAEALPFSENRLTITDIDVKMLTAERGKRFAYAEEDCIPFYQLVRETKLTRKYPASPFIPEDPAEIAQRAEEILQLQSYGLKKRVEHTHVKTIVVGISGGLDSCLSLLVMARTMDLLGRSRKDIVAISMPCFGTTKRTRSNAEKMCEELGVTFREIDISAAVRQHFADIGHDEAVRDVTYENSQARERTKILMNIANGMNGLVVGTGDLSELALGWATYNGDHMSMYGVNADIPKTLIRHVVRYEASRSEAKLAAILFDILDTPVSPELLPADNNGEIQQKTEDLVGPYELHDFFIYYALRYGFSPRKIYRLAQNAFGGTYSNEVILKWLRIFFRRFFIQQFKRSCLPDGPKIGSVGLSPRGDWNMPTDACSALWLKEIDALEP